MRATRFVLKVEVEGADQTLADIELVDVVREEEDFLLAEAAGSRWEIDLGEQGPLWIGPQFISGCGFLASPDRRSSTFVRFEIHGPIAPSEGEG